MKASDALFSLQEERLKVWKCGVNIESICVCYQDCEVKEDQFLIALFGEGDTFEEACESYLQKIRGKTLVFCACTSNRHEVRVLG